MFDLVQLLNYLPAAVFSFILTAVLTLLAIRFFPKWGLMDRPWKYNLKRKAIPYYGGLVLFFGFMISVLLFVRTDTVHLAGLLTSAALICGISFFDDLYGLSPLLRLFIQVLSALILVWAGVGIQSISNPLGPAIVLDGWRLDWGVLGSISVLGALFTIVWVVMVTNTMNFLDGLNGLPSGVTVISSLSLFLLSIRPDIHFDAGLQVPVATISIILFGCTLAFWLFDFYPAKILMGDTGSMFLGFLLASLAIFSGGKVATALLVMGFPILDAFWVIGRRVLSGHSPFKGDLKHLHHRLLELGFSQRTALGMIYTLCALFGFAAVFLDGTQKLILAGVMVAVMIVVGGIAVVLARSR